MSAPSCSNELMIEREDFDELAQTDAALRRNIDFSRSIASRNNRSTWGSASASKAAHAGSVAAGAACRAINVRPAPSR